MRNLVLPAVLLLLAACQSGTPVPRYLGPPERVDLSSCGGGAVLGLIGHPIADLPDSGGWGALRVIGPDQMVTMDYSESRLNVDIDGAGRIIGARCG